LTELSSRQTQIIDVSIKIISERGIQELTIKNLSKELLISEPAIYRHFKNKQDILIALLESLKNQNRLIDTFNPINQSSPYLQLKDAIREVLQKLTANPAISAIIFSEELFQNKSELSEIIQNIMSSNTEYFLELITEAQVDNKLRSDISPNQISLIVMGSIRHLVTSWRLKKFSFNLMEHGEKLLDTFDTLLKK
jgi:AcrR family transcriptional regulator